MSDFVVVDEKSRRRKARKIAAVINDFGCLLSGKLILDVGCGSGIISRELANHENEVIAMDISMRYVKKGLCGNRLTFLQADASALPFIDSSIDVIICNHILEHVHNKQRVIFEIKRVMKEGAVGYIAQGNRLWPIEPHYRLPFLSYLPRPLAERYLSALKGKKSYNITLPTYWEVCCLLRHNFGYVRNVTTSVVSNPSRYHAEDLVPFGTRIAHALQILFRLFTPFLPGWIFIVRK